MESRTCVELRDMASAVEERTRSTDACQTVSEKKNLVWHKLVGNLRPAGIFEHFCMCEFAPGQTVTVRYCVAITRFLWY